MLRHRTDARKTTTAPGTIKSRPYIGALEMTKKAKATEPNVSQPTITVPSQQSERQHDEDNLDEALEETFPASDPIAPSHIE